MRINLAAAARVVPLTALMLGACVSQSAYEKQGAELQQAAAEQSQLNKVGVPARANGGRLPANAGAGLLQPRGRQSPDSTDVAQPRRAITLTAATGAP